MGEKGSNKAKLRIIVNEEIEKVFRRRANLVAPLKDCVSLL